MKDFLNILNKLSKLDLSSYPIDDAIRYISQIGTQAGIGYTLHKDFPIFRTRPNEDDFEVFKTRSQLSYKPQEFNTTFQRSSTPTKTMFYGSILPPEFGEDDINNARLTSTFEASKTYRNNLFKSNEKITFSRWEANTGIKLYVVLPVIENDTSDSFTKFMNDELDKFMRNNKELAIKTKLTNQFFGNIFSNPNIRFDYDYIISALYTEMIIKSGFEGILYPSVKAQGKGYNVCLTPDCVDTKLNLKAAGEGRILKVGYQSTVVGEKQALITDDSKAFEYELMHDYQDPKIIIDELYKEYS